MPKKIQPGDLVAFPQQYISGVVARSFMYVVEEKPHAYGRVQYYRVTRLDSRQNEYHMAAGRVAHICANCLHLKKDHMPGGRCLYGPGKFAVLTPRKYLEIST